MLKIIRAALINSKFDKTHFSLLLFLKMKKVLPILIVATALLTPLYPVYAQPTDAMMPPSAGMPGSGNRPLVATAPGRLMVPNPGMRGMDPTMADKMADFKERLATRSAALKQKLAKFKDKAKATRVENINENLNTVNANVTSAMEKNLSDIQTALQKLKTKAAAAASEGKDITSLSSDIAKVETEWSEASDALNVQMAKDYTIAVTSESTVKTDAQNARNTLRTDLKSVHTAVKESRSALADAVSGAMSLLGGNNGQ